MQFVILLAIPAVMYFVLIRPQKKRQREQAAIMSAIDIGDEVVTTSGIYGFVTGKEDDMFWLEIDENVQIRIAKAAIQGKVGGATATPAVDSDSASKDPGKELGKESSKESSKEAPIDTTAGDDTDDKPDKK